MKLYHIIAENDQDAASATIDAIPAVQKAGGLVSASFNFFSDPDVPSRIVLQLPEGVDPQPFFPEREITYITDLGDIGPAQADLEEGELTDDNEAESERGSSGEDRGEEGAGEGPDSEEAAS